MDVGTISIVLVVSLLFLLAIGGLARSLNPNFSIPRNADPDNT